MPIFVVTICKQNKTNKMPKTMPKNKNTKKMPVTDYTHVETNIYKTGNRYRVRVGKFQTYCKTLKQARIQKRLLRQSWFSEPIF